MVDRISYISGTLINIFGNILCIAYYQRIRLQNYSRVQYVYPFIALDFNFSCFQGNQKG